MDEKETVALWMMANGFSTGHGDSVADMLNELACQIDVRVARAIDAERVCFANLCNNCSPQLIEGICPDSKAGMIVAELAGALHEVFADHDAVNRLSWNDRAAAAIAKATGESA